MVHRDLILPHVQIRKPVTAVTIRRSRAQDVSVNPPGADARAFHQRAARVGYTPADARVIYRFLCRQMAREQKPGQHQQYSTCDFPAYGFLFATTGFKARICATSCPAEPKVVSTNATTNAG